MTQPSHGALSLLLSPCSLSREITQRTSNSSSIPLANMSQSLYTLPLRRVGLSDIGIAGGKNASLGEMINNLGDLGILIPDGFVITVHAYRVFIESSNLDHEIRRLVKTIDFDSVESLRRAGLQIRQLIRNSKFPPALSAAIIEGYHQLSKQYDQTDT